MPGPPKSRLWFSALLIVELGPNDDELGAKLELLDNDPLRAAPRLARLAGAEATAAGAAMLIAGATAGLAAAAFAFRKAFFSLLALMISRITPISPRSLLRRRAKLQDHIKHREFASMLTATRIVQTLRRSKSSV